MTVLKTVLQLVSDMSKSYSVILSIVSTILGIEDCKSTKIIFVDELSQLVDKISYQWLSIISMV